MDLTKEFNILFNHKTINKNRVIESVKLCKDTSILFGEWIGNNYSLSDKGNWKSFNYKNVGSYTTEELFEIFKNEQLKKK